jgi:hypothetical protein
MVCLLKHFTERQLSDLSFMQRTGYAGPIQMKSNFTLQYLAKTLNIKFQHLFLLSKIKYVYGQAQAFHYGEFHFTYYVQMIT